MQPPNDTVCSMMPLILYSTGYRGSYRFCSAQAVSLTWRASHTRSEAPHRQLSPVGKPVLVACCSCCWVAAGILLGDSRPWSAFVLRLCTCRRCAVRLSHVAGATCPGIASILRSKKSSTPQSSSVPSANLTRNSVGAPDAAGPRISTCSRQYICKIHIDIYIQMLHINISIYIVRGRHACFHPVFCLDVYDHPDSPLVQRRPFGIPLLLQPRLC